MIYVDLKLSWLSTSYATCFPHVVFIFKHVMVMNASTPVFCYVVREYHTIAIHIEALAVSHGCSPVAMWCLSQYPTGVHPWLCGNRVNLVISQNGF